MLYLSNEEMSDKRIDREMGLDSVESLNGKESAATNYQSTGSIEDPHSARLKIEVPPTSQMNALEARRLKQRLRKLEQKELLMMSTFQQCIKNLENEIAVRDKNNQMIRSQIQTLKKDMKETTGDMEYISSYLAKNNSIMTKRTSQISIGSTKKNQKTIFRNRSGKLFQTACLKPK